MTGRRSAEITALLLKAKRVLEECGWQQGGDFVDDAGRLSLDGALNFAVTGRAATPSVGSGVIEGALLDVLISRDYDGVVADWNDEPDRRVSEVYALLDESIERIAAKGGA